MVILAFTTIPNEDYPFPTTVMHLAEVLQAPPHSSFLVTHLLTVNADPSRADLGSSRASTIYSQASIVPLSILIPVYSHYYRHTSAGCGQEGKVWLVLIPH